MLFFGSVTISKSEDNLYIVEKLTVFKDST